jgi:hypothetical protein
MPALPQLGLVHRKFPNTAHYVNAILRPREKRMEEGVSDHYGRNKKRREGREQRYSSFVFLVLFISCNQASQNSEF